MSDFKQMYPVQDNDSSICSVHFDRERFDDLDRLAILSAFQNHPAVEKYKTYITVNIDNIKTLAMCDSGNSAFTSCSKELADALGIKPADLEKIDGRESIGTAKASARMKIAGRTKKVYDLWFHPSLPPIRTKIVVLPELGMPLNLSGIDMQRYGISIVTGKYLQCRGKRVELKARRRGPEIGRFEPPRVTSLEANSQNSRSSPVFTSCDVIVRPYERVHVKAIAPKAHNWDETEGRVLACLSFAEKYEMAPWINAVVSLNSSKGREGAEIKVGMLNPNERPVKIPRGTYYGQIHAIHTCPEHRTELEPEICQLDRNSSRSFEHNRLITEKSEKSEPEPIGQPKSDRSATETAPNSYSIPPSPDKQGDPMAGDDVELPTWMSGPTTRVNWHNRYKYLSKLFKVETNPNLVKQEECGRFLGLLLAHWELFAWTGKYGKTSLVQHYIKTPPGGRPVTERYRPPNPVLCKSLKAQLEKWLSHGCIEPSDSAWNSNLLAVVKANDPSAVRWCVDYRKLNSVSEIDRFPIGDIQDNLSRLGKSKLFSCLDNSGAFHVIEIAPEDRHKTSFCSPYSCWQFTRLPFGLSGGPSSYARLILQVLRNIPPDQAVAYVDDILIHSETFGQHITNLDNVFKAYTKAGLKLNPLKCSFLQSKIDYLGHTVSAEGISPQETYLKVVKSWPIPKNRHQIMIFLGKTGYYRKFCKDYAKIAKPLTDLLKLDTDKIKLDKEVKERSKSGKTKASTSADKKALAEKIILSKSQRRKKLEEPVELSKEAIRSFEQLKLALTTAPILGHPRFDNLVNEPFVLDTDWCQETATSSGVLSQSQIQSDGSKVERVIGYSSKKLNKSQQNYSSPKGELCSILLMIEKFKYYLLVGKFLIRTDNKACESLKHNLDPQGYLSRWKCRLASYQFDIVHRAGSKHSNADALSRIEHAEPLTESEDVFDERTDRQYLFSIGAIDEGANQPITREERWTPEYIKELQEDDHDIATVRKWIKEGHVPTTSNRAQGSRDLKSYVNIYRNLSLDSNDVLRYQMLLSPIDEDCEPQSVNVVLLPPNALVDAIRLVHEKIAHAGVKNTIDATLQNVYGLELRDAAEYVCRTCLVCQQKGGKPKKNDHTLNPPRQGYPFQTLNLDIVGPLVPAKRTSNIYLLTAEDDYTRWLEAYPLKRATGAAVALKLVTELFARFGYPSFLKIDRGSHFLNSDVLDLAKITGIRVLTSPAYHPQSNKIERAHRSLKNALQAMILDVSAGDPTSWETHLPTCLFALRCRRSRATDYSPYELLFASKPNTELSLIFGPEPRREEYSSKRSYALAHAHHMQTAFRWANENITGEIVRARKYYYSQPSRSFAIGQKVWLLTPIVRPGMRKSFVSPFSGPWTVSKQVNEVVYQIDPHPSWSRRKSEVVTADRLKIYLAPDDEGESIEETHPPPQLADLALPGNAFLESIPLQGRSACNDDDDEGRGEQRDDDGDDEEDVGPPQLPLPNAQPRGEERWLDEQDDEQQEELQQPPPAGQQHEARRQARQPPRADRQRRPPSPPRLPERQPDRPPTLHAQQAGRRHLHLTHDAPPHAHDPGHVQGRPRSRSPLEAEHELAPEALRDEGLHDRAQQHPVEQGEADDTQGATGQNAADGTSGSGNVVRRRLRRPRVQEQAGRTLPARRSVPPRGSKAKSYYDPGRRHKSVADGDRGINELDQPINNKTSFSAVDLTDQTSVFQKRRQFAEQNDSRPINRSSTHINKLRDTQKRLEKQSHLISNHQQRAARNLARLNCMSQLSLSSSSTSLSTQSRNLSNKIPKSQSLLDLAGRRS